MDINKIKAFLILSECKSFTKTSEILYCSQPAISKQIKSLESELRVPLINRNPNNITLTIQGKYFKKYAESIVKLYENSKEHIRQIEDLNEGTLYFGATNFNGVYIVPPILKVFKNKYPNIKINMVINSSYKLLDLLDKNQIEFLFLSHYVDIDSKKYISKKYCNDELVLIVSKSHKLADKDVCSFSDLEEEVFISKGEHSSLYKFLSAQIKDYPNRKNLIINNQEAIKQAVIQNLGISIISEAAVYSEVQSNLISTLKIKDYNLTRNINLVYTKDMFLTPAGKEFINLLEI